VDYVIGLAKNGRLQRIVGAALQQAEQQFAQTRQAARVFQDFSSRTHQSWSRARRVVGKAEHVAKGPNPRFVVASLAAEAYPAQTLYEQEYCARGPKSAPTARYRSPPAQSHPHANPSLPAHPPR